MMSPGLFAGRDWTRHLPTGDGCLRYFGSFAPNHVELFKQLDAALSWEQRDLRMPGRAAPIPLPRLECWIGPVPYTYSGVRYEPRSRPSVPGLDALWRRVSERAGVAFNAVFVNKYRHGTDSIGWHADDEPVLGPADQVTIASLSLGATRKFALKNRFDGTRLEIDLEPGSLLIMDAPIQARWLHSVPKTARPINPRINLTFRRVLEPS